MTNSKHQISDLIVIPTYNEAENVKPLLAEIADLEIHFEILFVDDNSPDGTGDIITAISRTNANVHIIHRPGKLGVGSAHLDGIRWALDNGYKCVVTMDCDFAHRPGLIAKMLKLSEDSDIVIGSRFLKKGSLPGWTLWRRILTYFGHMVTKALLKMPYDATGAFRVYRLDKLPLEVFDHIKATSYSFFIESLYEFHKRGSLIAETPINLPARTYGHSKMRAKDILVTVALILSLAYRAIFRRSSS